MCLGVKQLEKSVGDPRVEGHGLVPRMNRLVVAVQTVALAVVDGIFHLVDDVHEYLRECGRVHLCIRAHERVWRWQYSMRPESKQTQAPTARVHHMTHALHNASKAQTYARACVHSTTITLTFM